MTSPAGSQLFSSSVGLGLANESADGGNYNASKWESSPRDAKTYRCVLHTHRRTFSDMGLNCAHQNTKTTNDKTRRKWTSYEPYIP